MFTGAMELLGTLLARGGWVMWPLLVLSVLAVALCLERAWFWIRLHHPARVRGLTSLNAALRDGRFDEAKRMLARDRSLYSQLAARLVEPRTPNAERRGPISDAAAFECVDEFRPAIERFMPTLSTIITAAPLLGILGTVTGLIGSFQLLGEARVVTDPREISGGIAEALLTTATGLIIALVTLFPYVIFKGQVERAYRRMEILIASAQTPLAASRSTPLAASRSASTASLEKPSSDPSV